MRTTEVKNLSHPKPFLGTIGNPVTAKSHPYLVHLWFQFPWVGMVLNYHLFIVQVCHGSNLGYCELSTLESRERGKLLKLLNAQRDKIGKSQPLRKS